ncbi:MAG: pyridoxal phosphate-dependent aminotransferase [Silicimonas sp.]|nr:pyridoxal phosphate-dependent aminotransferase [Silicimonas sp.]
MKMPLETPLAQSLPASVPFVGPEAIERRRGRPFAARLGANESTFGPSPRVREAITAAAAEAWMYGDPECTDLRAGLAAHLGCAPDQLVAGEGIDGLLGYVVRLFVAPGDRVVTSDGAYPTFNYHVAGFGGTLVKVPYRDDREDLDALLTAARDSGAKMIYLANPDNPMGSWHPAAAIEAMIAELPENCLLLLDEAYVEFAPADAIPRVALDDPRVIRMRTFSKAHGLAGLRVGYAFGAREVIRSFDKIRNHFGLGRVAQAAALAALADSAWLDEVRRQVAEARDRISAIASANGLISLPSATNFVTVDCGRDGAYARAVLEALEDRDVFVRMPFSAPGNRCIRISAGRPEDLDRLADALPAALKAAKSA